MERVELEKTNFMGQAQSWKLLRGENSTYKKTDQGLMMGAAPGEDVRVDGYGVHTRDGDMIELTFGLCEQKGKLVFGFAGGAEWARVTADFEGSELILTTSDATIRQPVAKKTMGFEREQRYTLSIDKSRNSASYVGSTNIHVSLNNEAIFDLRGLDMLPEMGIDIKAESSKVIVHRFRHIGKPYRYPEFLHVGGYQVLNSYDVEKNLESICTGILEASQKGVEFLVTPESSLSGLLNADKHTIQKLAQPCIEAEKKVREFIKKTPDAPYVVVGVPELRDLGEGKGKGWYNTSRLYDPDGFVSDSFTKIHSCESGFAHGKELNEFDIKGIPACLYICHDYRYPDVWTLPVMFGARLLVQPTNGANLWGTISFVESTCKRATQNHNCVQMHINAKGSSYILVPEGGLANIAAISSCAGRNSTSFPMVSPPKAELIHSKVRLFNAYGYWPMRSLKASESMEKAYSNLYKAYGGIRRPGEILL